MSATEDALQDFASRARELARQAQELAKLIPSQRETAMPGGTQTVVLNDLPRPVTLGPKLRDLARQLETVASETDAYRFRK